MATRIFIFNIIYYGITFLFVKAIRDDMSSSLGYGFFIIGFWIVAGLLLDFLLRQKIIQPTSFFQRIGVFTATPVLSIVAVWLIFGFKENVGSERYFDKDGYRHWVRTIIYSDRSKIKRIEYYRKKIDTVTAAGDDDEWEKDSTWLYFSEEGDTLKSESY